MPIYKLKPGNAPTLCVRTMGKVLTVTAIYDNDDDANRHMERAGNTDAVVAVCGNLVILADTYDKGSKIKCIK